MFSDAVQSILGERTEIPAPLDSESLLIWEEIEQNRFEEMRPSDVKAVDLA